MNTQLALEAYGLEELDGPAMLAVNGGLDGGFWVDIAKAVIICIVTSADSLIDGARDGWAAASA